MRSSVHCGANATSDFAQSRALYNHAVHHVRSTQSFVVTPALKRHLKIAYNIEMMPVLASLV